MIAFISLLPAKALGLAIDTIVSVGYKNIPLLFGWCVSLITVEISFLFYNYLVNIRDKKLAFKLRKKYLNHLFELDSRFYEEYEKGDLIARVTNDLDAITQAATALLEGIIF